MQGSHLYFSRVLVFIHARVYFPISPRDQTSFFLFRPQLPRRKIGPDQQLIIKIGMMNPSCSFPLNYGELSEPLAACIAHRKRANTRVISSLPLSKKKQVSAEIRATLRLTRGRLPELKIKALAAFIHLGFCSSLQEVILVIIM